MSKKIFENWELDFIKKNYNNMTYNEIALIINNNNTIKKNEKQIRNKARSMGLLKTNQTIIKDFFNIINSEKKAYWMGFIFADGYIVTTERNAEVSIELGIKDIGHLEKLNKDINANVKVTRKTKKSGEINGVYLKERELCSIRLYSKQLANDLINNNVVNNKTKSDLFPKLEDRSLFLHFLRGFLDGDGCICYCGKTLVVKFTNYNDKFLKYVKDRLENDFGVKCALYKENNFKYNLNINGSNKDKIKFLDLIYKDSNIFLERKYQIYKNAV